MEEAAVDVILPILEASIVMASYYAKCCGRDIVTKTDIEYALKYNAMYNVGTHIGSLYPEIYEEESDEEDIIEECDEDEEFSRYSGDDELCLKLNNAYDEWSSWSPSGPAETALYNALNLWN